MISNPNIQLLRPLPDERPRQSVANLIGRFEQHTKRQSLTPPNGVNIPIIPRASSSLSHSLGDAAKEEIKEKREWPPRPKASLDVLEQNNVVEDTKPTPPIDAPVSDPTPEEPVAKVADVVPTATVSEAHDVAPSTTDTPIAQATSGKSSVERVKPVTTTKTTIRTPVTPSKSKPIATKATPRASRTPAKSPPSSYNTLSASTSTPAAPSLKSSVSSPASKASGAARSRPSSSVGHRPPITPVKTPLRSKTPSGIRPKTPSASTSLRAKSPGSTLR